MLHSILDTFTKGELAMATLSLTTDRPIDRGVVVWLTVVHIVGCAGLYQLWASEVTWQTILFSMFWFANCHLSISAGMHRLYAHVAYQAAKVLQIYYLLFSSGVLQGSALWWSGVIHRRHHAYSDQPEDPHNIQKGFWWAHVGWTLRKPLQVERDRFKELADLLRDPLVKWQQHNYHWLSYTMGVVVPAGFCALWGDFLNGILVAAGLRLMVQYHATWSINSVAHCVWRK